MSEPNEMYIPEPWEYADEIHDAGKFKIYSSVARRAGGESPKDNIIRLSGADAEPTIRRIVACVNSCAGITNAQLESAPLKARIEKLETLVSDMKDNTADDDAILKFQKRRLQLQHEEIVKLEAELAAERVKRERMQAEMKRYLPILERLEENAMAWDQFASGFGIGTLNGYRAALDAEKGE